MRELDSAHKNRKNSEPRKSKFLTLFARKAAMKKSLIAVFALSLLAGSAAAQVWFKGTVDEAVAKAKAESKLVLVDFYSDG
jgi:hypothetical protein